jgi:hypothetical protein
MLGASNDPEFKAWFIDRAGTPALAATQSYAAPRSVLPISHAHLCQ